MPAAAGSHLSPVWLSLFDLGADGGLLEAAEQELGLLSADERSGDVDRAASLVGERRLARIALRLALAAAGEARAIGCALDVSPRGKPSLAGSQWAFSVSHSAGRVLIGIARTGPIGVDLEARGTLRMADQRIAQIVAAAAGLGADLSEAGDRGVAPVAAWCVLEAYAKARGDGIGVLLGLLGILAPGSRSRHADDVGRAALHLQPRSGGVADGLGVAVVDVGAGLVAAVCAPMVPSALTDGGPLAAVVQGPARIASLVAAARGGASRSG